MKATSVKNKKSLNPFALNIWKWVLIDRKFGLSRKPISVIN